MPCSPDTPARSERRALPNTALWPTTSYVVAYKRNPDTPARSERRALPNTAIWPTTYVVPYNAVSILVDWRSLAEIRGKAFFIGF
jgi:hypothetical protein